MYIIPCSFSCVFFLLSRRLSLFSPFCLLCRRNFCSILCENFGVHVRMCFIRFMIPFFYLIYCRNIQIEYTAEMRSVQARAPTRPILNAERTELQKMQIMRNKSTKFPKWHRKTKKKSTVETHTHTHIRPDRKREGRDSLGTLMLLHRELSSLSVQQCAKLIHS